jgi:PAS domain S-box-containing protein
MTELRDAQTRFEALAECTSDAVFITDFDSARFVEVNTRACELFGYTRQELCTKSGRMLHPPEDTDIVSEISRELVDNSVVFRPAVRLQHKLGHFFWAELRSRCYESDGRTLYITFIRDVSTTALREKELSDAYQTLNETELDLLRTSRLAALGQLATGVAHEVNNPAAALLANQESIDADLGSLHSGIASATLPQSTKARLLGTLSNARSAVADSIDSVQRISAIVNKLQGYARIDTDAIASVTLNEAAINAQNLLRTELKVVTSVTNRLNAEQTVPGDVRKLTQVCTNLLLNAIHATRNVANSSITIETEDRSDGVLLRVTDNGEGIPFTLREKIFEPFFTTKPPAVGTGLGLPVCSDIVTKHRGRITLLPSAQGACFEVFIPVETGFQVVTKSETQLVAQAPSRILVVDDEPSLVRAYRRILGKSNHVVGAYGGEEALRILASDDNFDLILCDIMMPGVNGLGVFTHLQRCQPHLLQRLVFCSGGPTTPETVRFLAENAVDLVLKPVTQDVLLSWVNRKTDARRSQRAL